MSESWEVVTTYNIVLKPARTKCLCCMAQNVSFVSLLNCKHSEFLKAYYPIEFPNVLVCQVCHRMLSKIELFKQQVQETSKILNNMIPQHGKNGNLSTIRINNLQLSTIDITTADSSFKLEHKSKTTYNSTQNKSEIMTENKSENMKENKSEIMTDNKSEIMTDNKSEIMTDKKSELMTELKLEIDDGSEFEIDRPLSDVKAIANPKKKRVRKKKTKNSIKKKYNDKMRLVTLSTEEMMEERDRESKKKGYLKLPFKCESCIKGFEYEITMKDHNLKKHAKNKHGFECTVCRSVLSSELSFKQHCKRHMCRYECVACGKRTTDFYTMVSHYNQRHRGADNFIDSNLTCDLCDFTTYSYRTLRYHRGKHVNKGKHKCVTCDKTFFDSGALKKHMLVVHNTSGPTFACNECDKVYKSMNGLNSHKLCRHGDGDRAYCVTCRKHYTSRQGLHHHLRTHSAHSSDSKRFICDECGAKFLFKKRLEEHIHWKHLNIQHKCNICNKGFSTAKTLKIHVDFVHEKKQMPRNKICDYCGRGFTTQEILRTHIRTHTGERPLSCAHCPATFAHSSALYTHKKLLHKGKT